MKRLGDPPHICLITEGRSDPANFQSESTRILTTIREAVSDGVNIVQIREKALPSRLLYELVRDAVDILAATPSIVVVNDRVDIALAAEADGVHLRESSLHPSIVRQRFPRELIIGVSTHSLAAAMSAVSSDADYVVVGPVFKSPGKDRLISGSELKHIYRELENFPVLALGGVDPHNVKDAMMAGASGIAAIRSLNNAASRRRLCKSIASYYSRAVE